MNLKELKTKALEAKKRPTFCCDEDVVSLADTILELIDKRWAEPNAAEVVLRRKLTIATEALKYYEREKHYMYDLGVTAREALAKIEAEPAPKYCEHSGVELK